MTNYEVHLGIDLNWIVPEVSKDHLDLVIAKDFHKKVLIYDSEVYHIQGLHDFLRDISLARKRSYKLF